MIYLCQIIQSDGTSKWKLYRASSRYSCFRYFLKQRLYVQRCFDIKNLFVHLRFPQNSIQVQPKHWNIFFEQLQAQLAQNGTLLLALKALYQQKKLHPLQQTFILQAIELLNHGYFIGPLWENPKLGLSQQQIKLLQCAEQGGYFAQGIARVLYLFKLQLRIREQIRHHLIYPKFIFAMALVLGSVINFFLFPKLMDFMQQQAIPMNFFMRILSNLNEHSTALLGFCFFVLSTLYIYCKWKNISLRNYFEQWITKRSRWLRYSMFSLDLGELLQNKIPLLESLKLSLVHLRKTTTFDQVSFALHKGATLAQALSGLPEDFRHAIEIAELKNDLSSTLLRLSQQYYARYENQWNVFMKWIEPASLLILALLIGVSVLCIFYPILQIFQSLHWEG